MTLQNIEDIPMKTTIKLEELGLLLLAVFAFYQLPFSWWWFLVLILAPDISMLGYLFGNKVGAWLYNLFHHRGLAVVCFLIGMYTGNNIIELIAVMLFAHASLDRVLGYGLKYEKGFKYTHLGEIGR